MSFQSLNFNDKKLCDSIQLKKIETIDFRSADYISTFISNTKKTVLREYLNIPDIQDLRLYYNVYLKDHVNFLVVDFLIKLKF